MINASLFGPTAPELVALPLVERADIWLHVLHGARIPTRPVVRPRDPDRRERCRLSLALFLESYFADVYRDPCEYHTQTVARLNDEILCRDPLVFKSCDSAPRGLGKTTVRRLAAVWAGLYGHEPMVAFGSYSDKNAESHLQTIKHWLYTNPILNEDFPEITGWVRRIKNDPKRAAPVEWSDRLMKLPNGCFFVARGIFSGLVGFNVESLRPCILFMDDIETRETIESDAETGSIGQLIDQQLLKLHDPRRRAIYDVTGTVRSESCNIARYTDPARSPGWNGRRLKALTTDPERTDLWEAWQDICKRHKAPPPEIAAMPDDAAAESLGLAPASFALLKNEGFRHALKFYVIHRAEMDAGAVLLDPIHIPIWECFRTIAEDGLKTYMTELQSMPFSEEESAEVRKWTVDFIRSHSTNYDPMSLPADCSADIVTLGADVHSHGIYYVFRAWRMDGTSWGIEQGVSEVHSWQGASPIERARSIQTALARLWETALAGWRAGSKDLALRLGFVDEGWETTIVRDFCGDKLPRLVPVKGFAGLGRPKFQASKENPQSVNLGVDHFKLELARLLQASRDELQVAPGYWFLPKELKLSYCKHLCAERWQPKGERSGADVQEYEWKVYDRNNHWWDCEVYATAAAFAAGVKFVPTRPRIQKTAPAAGPVAERAKPFRRRY